MSRQFHSPRWALLALLWARTALADDAGLPNGAPIGPPALLFHADVAGNFAQPACGGASPIRPDFADLLSALEQSRARARASGAPPPIVLLGGNTLGPGLFARGLIERDGAAGGALLAGLLARGRYDAMALGHGDLALPRARLEQVIGAVVAGGIPVLAANLTCAPGSHLCADLLQHVVVERGAERFAVTATISPQVLGGLPRPLREGLTLGPPLQAIRAVVERARAVGVRRIILMAEVPRGSAGLEELLRLQRDLISVPEVVVLLATGGGDGSPVPLRLVRRDGAPPIVGSTDDTAGVAEIHLPVAATPAQATIDVLTASTASPDPTARALLEPRAAEYCRRYGRQVGPGQLRGPLTRDQWLAYVLAIMRRRAGAEIALLNRDFIKTGQFPLVGTLRRSELLRAMPYHATLAVTRMGGGEIATLLAPALANPRLGALGIERAGDGVTVNGRAIDKARSYRVATVSFLAEGGDEIFAPGAFKVDELPDQPDLRDLVEAFVASETAREDGDPTLDPATDFGPPAAARALLVGIGDLGLDFTDTAISRQPGYAEPQLVRAEQRSIKGEFTAALQLRAPRHEADGRLRTVYGYARNRPADGPAVATETADLIALSGIYNFRGLRDLTLRAPRLAVPDPYARVLLESEITRPDASIRGYRHAEMTTTVGGLFALTPKLRVRGGPGLRKQLLAPGSDGRVRLLFEAGASVDPIAIASFGALVTKLEGLVDYVFVDPAGTREHQLKASAKLSFPLLPTLFLTTGVDAFAVQRQGGGWGASYDTTIGLRVHFDRARQSL